MLEHNFNNIVIYHKGFEALEYVISKRPRLVIIESKLPELSANDIIKAIKFKGIKSNFIVLTDDNSTHCKNSFSVKIKYINPESKDFESTLVKELNLIKITLVSDNQKPNNQLRINT
ncbi:hypothetical protein [Winogradskyella haliclonae]|uniref:Response regulatory domain-containing protein n=1 Tax=Winogradskyella haliclonae TaxID=2048558 RepID=A0ABQ2BVF9_9FLAO|nr:hypothetical protein [Winogradskyella haliclonae]GGI56415.1 hypothetical protein GCM10011444_07240 [Winogradskyella haliclonae]